MICISCNKEEKHFAKNLCKRCYHRQNANDNYKRNPQHFRQNSSEWRRKHPDIVIKNNKIFRDNNSEYIKQKGKEHYEKNPYYYKEGLKRFSINNPGYFQQKRKEFNVNNPGYFQQKSREFKINNPNYFKIVGKKRYEQNPTLYRQKTKNFRESNPEYMKNWVRTPRGSFLTKINHHERREKIKNLEHKFTDREWFDKIALTKGICPVCFEPFIKNHPRKKMTIDHEPSIKKAPTGFQYKIGDVTPMCKSCNSKKSANNTIKWQKNLK